MRRTWTCTSAKFLTCTTLLSKFRTLSRSSFPSRERSSRCSQQRTFLKTSNMWNRNQPRSKMILTKDFNGLRINMASLLTSVPSCRKTRLVVNRISARLQAQSNDRLKMKNLYKPLNSQREFKISKQRDARRVKTPPLKKGVSPKHKLPETISLRTTPWSRRVPSSTSWTKTPPTK